MIKFEGNSCNISCYCKSAEPTNSVQIVEILKIIFKGTWKLNVTKFPRHDVYDPNKRQFFSFIFFFFSTPVRFLLLLMDTTRAIRLFHLFIFIRSFLVLFLIHYEKLKCHPVSREEKRNETTIAVMHMTPLGLTVEWKQTKGDRTRRGQVVHILNHKKRISMYSLIYIYILKRVMSDGWMAMTRGFSVNPGEY